MEAVEALEVTALVSGTLVAALRHKQRWGLSVDRRTQSLLVEVVPQAPQDQRRVAVTALLLHSCQSAQLAVAAAQAETTTLQTKLVLAVGLVAVVALTLVPEGLEQRMRATLEELRQVTTVVAVEALEAAEVLGRQVARALVAPSLEYLLAEPVVVLVA